MMSVDLLNGWGATWAAFMTRALVDSTVLLAVVAVAWLPMRRRMSAQFAHGLFLLVLLKLLAPPIPTSWPSWTAAPSLSHAAGRVATWAAGEDRPFEPTATVEGPIVAEASRPEPIVEVATPPVVAPIAKVEATLSTPAILMLGWAVIAVLMLLRFVRAIGGTRRLIRESVPVVDGSGWFPVDFEGLRRASGVRGSVRWAVSPSVTSPAVGGLFRPTVVMPPDLDDGLSPKQLTWVLLHELAHIRRGDLWVVTVQRLVQAAFFFHPVVHLANWSIDQLREYACDDAALAAAQTSRHDCGEGFLTIVGRTVDHTPSYPAPVLGLFESRMLIHRRLLRILDKRRKVHERLSPSAILGLVALAAIVLPYGQSRESVADIGQVSPRTPIDEARLFAIGSTFLHDDRADSAGKGRSPVLAVAYSPDGKTLATAGEDSAIVVRDVATNAVLSKLEGHEDAVTCLNYSPDGSTLASGGYDRSIRLWDSKSGRVRAKLEGHESWVFALAFSPDGRSIASCGSDKTVRIWDAVSGRVASILTGHASAVRAVGFSPDGKSLATAGADRSAIVWDVRTLKPRLMLKGHSGTIRALAFSPDGRSIATAGEDGDVKLWGSSDGRERATLSGHSDMVLALAFSPTGQTLASAGLDASVKLWDPKAARERATLLGHPDGVGALSFAPSGRQIASTGYDGSIRLWDAAAPTLSAAITLNAPSQAKALAFSTDGKTVHVVGDSLATYDPVAGLAIGQPATTTTGLSLAVSPDGRLIAVGGVDGKVHLIDASTHLEVAAIDGHDREVTAVAFDPSGRTLVSGGRDSKVITWGVAGRNRAGVDLDRDGPINAIRYSPDGRTMAVLAGVELAFLDVDSGETRGTQPGVVAVAFSGDGRSVATAGLDGRIAILDAATDSERMSWTQADALTVAIGPDGRFACTGHVNGDLILWDAANGRRLATLRGHVGPVSSLAFAPDGRSVASVGSDKTLRLWNLGARKLAPRASLKSELSCPGPVVASPDGKTLAVAEGTTDSDGSIALWDLATRRVRATLRGHSRGVTSLAFTPDGLTLASSSCDRTIRVWDAISGESKGEFASTNAVVRLAYSPDGATLVAAGENGILTLWDASSGSEIKRIAGFRGHLFALAISPDGRWIATGGGRNGLGEVKIFDASTHAEVFDMAGHSAPVRSIAFGSDGMTLASGGIDSTVRVWDLANGKPRLVLGGFPDCVRSVAIAPDGRSMAVAGRADGVVALFNASNGAEVARLVGHNGLVPALTYTRDGRSIATGGADASIKLWDVP